MNQPSICVLEPFIPAPRRAEGAAQEPERARTAQAVSGASTAWRVLVVEGAADEAEALSRDLRRHGHEVDHVATGSEALRAYEDADLILLDLELSDLDGLEVCRTIRTACDVPIIAVTARGTELDRVLGLQAGADDYLTKPYGFRELMARMDAVMRRARPQVQTSSIIAHGPLLIDTGSREVTLAGRRITVTRKEFDLLHLLASHPDTVIPRKRLMQQIWGDSWSRRTVDTHVSTLRNKLGASTWVITVRGVGFRLGHG
ncbi:response regulator transcription factor [Streptomyces tubercidicus]|uniref:Sensory transduction protein RegX3 n=1 Tax=Streptomyces tubercidicus TaxID=47759 RepID=A0A640UWJ3_9ACTN|nr:response regulator transcription factor [Streptomyces tubercidicus]WAU14470.1 response regulator transcription factor [Streptomyces tubercidicus]GFE40209.1 DNA-binding response regulator [Streptomyces tubercidicus]